MVLKVWIVRWNPVDRNGCVSTHVEERCFLDKALGEECLRQAEVNPRVMLHTTRGQDCKTFNIIESEQDFDW